MYFTFLFLFILTPSVLCEANLQINKKVNEVLTPLSTPGSKFYKVEEKIGTHFSLLCELVFSKNEIGFDAHISWIKISKFNITLDFAKLSEKNLEDFYSLLTTSELNKAEKKFAPLKISDNGSYICFTVKFKQYVTLDLIVRSNDKIINERVPSFRETMFCSEMMFRCKSNGHCIWPHYLCDGKADCKDASDESVEHCNEDPCRDKLKCEDGRCIPTAWCCDRNHDVNCNVTNRPKCCQVLSENYEELEYGLPNLTAIQQSNTSAKYLFISVCILSILFSLVLLLLVLSKVMIFAKKTALQQRHGPSDIAYYHHSRRNSRDQGMAMCHIPYEFYRYRNSNVRNLTLDENDSVNPLLDLSGRRLDDRPPAYSDLIRSSHRTERYLEPPPPYTSREVLNDERNNNN